jgi:hypothetical protein
MAEGETLTSTRVLLPAITIYPGTSELVPADAWEEAKKKPAVQAMLDHGVLTVERKQKDVPIGFDSAAAEPEVPEHLQEEEFVGAEAIVKAKVTRAKPGAVTL